MSEDSDATVGSTVSLSPVSGRSSRLPFTRADAFGAILEAATVPGVFTRGEASFAFYEFVSRAHSLRSSDEAHAAALAATLLDVLDQILALRLKVPFVADAVPRPGGGAFLLALDLIAARDRVGLLERTKSTLQVPDELAGRIITVLAGPVW